MRVLLVDDDEASLRLLKQILGHMGYEVDTAADGQEGWERFQSAEYPLIISDWLMPNVDGLEFCRRVRGYQTARYTYFVLLTILSGKRSFLDGMEAGADDFLNKPIDQDELVARLRVAERILNLQREVVQLSGLLPICVYCKRIRELDDQWEGLETYLAKRMETSVSHTICPSCYQSMVAPDLERFQAKS